jgi:hypothetical protein
MNITLATPCSVPWSEMKGDDRVRRCEQCQLDVYKAEHLTSAEVVDKLCNTEGRVCMQFFRRFDGTLLTKDCPRGFELLRREWQRSEFHARRRWKRAGACVLAVGLFGIVLVNLFADNLRRLCGMSSDGGMTGADDIAQRRPAPGSKPTPSAKIVDWNPPADPRGADPRLRPWYEQETSGKP